MKNITEAVEFMLVRLALQSRTQYKCEFDELMKGHFKEHKTDNFTMQLEKPFVNLKDLVHASMVIIQRLETVLENSILASNAAVKDESNGHIQPECDSRRSIKEYLKFPRKVTKIYVVSVKKDIRDLAMLMEYKVSGEKIVYVGLNAEWSAYVNPSRATILQMAFMDLESNQISPEGYSKFLIYLFNTPGIVKIGFQFGEGHHQHRAGFRNVAVLYKPNNVVCVGKSKMRMMEEVTKLKNSDESNKGGHRKTAVFEQGDLVQL